MVKRVLLAAPRGFCAGVERAIETVERALELYGPPVYVRKQIVHNVHVVRDLEQRGAVFVESEASVPEGARLVLSAHGVAPAVHDAAAARRLETIDATCPLVTKVHAETRRYAAEGYTVVLIGHEGHEEVVGTHGEAPEAVRIVGSVAEAEALAVPDPARVAYVTQTTLSVDETSRDRRRPAASVPGLRASARGHLLRDHEPPGGGERDARRGRRAARDRLAEQLELEAARRGRAAAGVESHLIDDETAIDERWLDGRETVGVTAGASAPERLVTRVCDWFRARGVTDIRVSGSIVEDVFFRLPVELRRTAGTTA